MPFYTTCAIRCTCRARLVTAPAMYIHNIHHHYQHQQQQQPQKQQTIEAPPQPSLEELVRKMTMQNMQFQQETRASILSLTNQMGQLATQLNQQ